MIATSTPNTLLRKALRANALFSFTSGLLFMIASNNLAKFLGIADTSILGLFGSSVLLAIIGFNLLGFAGIIWYVSSQSPIVKLQVQVISGLDFGWVIGTALILLTNILPLTRGGSWLLLIIAEVVLLFALLQLYSLHQRR